MKNASSTPSIGQEIMEDFFFFLPHEQERGFRGYWMVTAWWISRGRGEARFYSICNNLYGGSYGGILLFQQINY
jgi:hypothetical protein